MKKILAFLMLVASAVIFNTAIAESVLRDRQWLEKVVTSNTEKWCTPDGINITELGKVIETYVTAHPELHNQISDQQALTAIKEHYPCAASSANRPAIGKSITVTPSGEYASINTESSLAVLRKLASTTGPENDGLIKQVTENPENYFPPVLFTVAILLYRKQDIQNAIFWLNAGRLRGEIDGALCTDISARSGVVLLVQQMPRDLIKRQYDDPVAAAAMLERVIKWDESTPYNYDRRWISLHGVSAINSGLSPDRALPPIDAPRDQWDAIAAKTRDKYRMGITQSIEAFAKQRETPPK